MTSSTRVLYSLMPDKLNKIVFLHDNFTLITEYMDAHPEAEPVPMCSKSLQQSNETDDIDTELLIMMHDACRLDGMATCQLPLHRTLQRQIGNRKHIVCNL